MTISYNEYCLLCDEEKSIIYKEKLNREQRKEFDKKDFINNKFYQYPKKEDYADNQSYFCDICFTNKSIIDGHIVIEDFKCNFCCVNKHDLIKHLKTKKHKKNLEALNTLKEEDKFTCPHCNIVLHKEGMKNHKERNHHIFRYPGFKEQYNISCNNLVHNNVRFANTHHLFDYIEDLKDVKTEVDKHRTQLRKFNNKKKQPYIRSEIFKEYLEKNGQIIK